jgi:hypothetical protein
LAGEVVRRLTISATSTGIDETTGKINTLANASAVLADVTDTSAKKALSAEAAYNRQTLAMDPAAKAQDAIAKATKTANDALAQGIITQDDHAKRVQAITDKYTTQVGATAAISKATQALQFQMASMAGGLGLTGSILSAFGPWGFAAAVGLGAVSSALSTVSDMSHALAEKAKEIKEFSEATGLTTIQFQALRSEAGKFGIDSESMAAGLSKFTAGFQELRLGSGNLLTDINKINPALAEQMKTTTDSATAFTLFGKAVAETDDIFQRNALLKAGMGKGAATFGAFFETSPDVKGLTDAFAAAGKGIDDNLIKKLAQLQIDIAKSKAAASSIFSQTFGTSTLEEEKSWAQTLVSLALAFKSVMDSFSRPSPWVEKFLNVVQTGSFDPTTQARRKLTNGLDAGAETSSSAQSVSDAVPRTGTYQSITDSQIFGPNAPNKKTLEDLSVEAKNLTSVLGSAASPAQKLDAAIQALGVTAKATGISQSDLAKGIDGLKLDSAISQQSAYTSALGAATPISELLYQKELQLSKARNDSGGKIKQGDIDNQIRLTTEQYNGVAAVKAQIDSTIVQTAAAQMTTGAAAEYTAVQTKLNEAIRNGHPLEVDQEAALRKTAAALGDKTKAAEQMTVALATGRDRQTAFLSPEDLQIANQLKGIYGDDIPKALNSGEAAALRMNNVLKSINDTARSAVSTFATDFVHALQAGSSLIDALKSSVASLGTKLMDTGLNSLVTSGFNALTGSGAAGGAASGAALSAGGTSAAAAITAACTAGGAALAAGGTAAGTALGAGGTAAGVGVDVGTSVGGAELVTSGAAAGGFIATAAAALGISAATLSAIMGPLAALLAVAAGIGMSFFGGSNNAKKDATNASFVAQTAQITADAATRKQQDNYDAASAQLGMNSDPNSLSGQVQAFDLQANQQRTAEMQKGGYAIVELEKSLAAQRQAIIEKSNAAITKTMDDWLNSVKTGSQSILSPADQLAYEQNLFNTQLSGAKGGNSDDLNALTSTASALLTLAQNFYASGTGYADTYKSVTDAITSIANGAGQTVLPDANAVGWTTDASVVNADMGGGNIATKWVAGYATGGEVLNGKYNSDSVTAKLAGGEHVTRASSVNSATRPSLDYINRTGKTPGNDNKEVARILTQGFNGQTQVLSDKLDMVADRIARLENTTRQKSNQRRVAGTEKAA